MKRVILPIIIVLSITILVVSCATMPEGFEAAEQAALDAKARADEFNTAEIVPLEYEAADSVLKTAVAQKEEKKYEESMKLYNEAEQKFIKSRKSAEFKVETDTVYDEAEVNMKEIEKKREQIKQLQEKNQ